MHVGMLPVEVRLLALHVPSTNRVESQPAVEGPAILIGPRLDGRQSDALHKETIQIKLLNLTTIQYDC